MTNDRFKITVELGQIVELSVRTPFSAYDQRENYSYTDYKIETKKFASVEDAKQWVSENSGVQVKSAALVTNITDEFKQ
jgi:hypothetical protein